MKQLLKKILNKFYPISRIKQKLRTMLNNFLFFFLWKLTYKIACLKKTDDKLLLFVASNDYTMPAEYESLFNLAKEKGYNPVCLYKAQNSSSVGYINELKKIRNDLRFIRYSARAKATFLYDYYFPAYANTPRKSTKLIQVWHGCGAFKKFGHSLKNSSFGLSADLLHKYNVHKTYTDIIASSEYIIPKYAEAFCVKEDVIKPVGVPRTDVYFDEKFVQGQKMELISKFPELADKKIILYAPTFRGKSFSKSYNDKSLDFLKLKEIFGEKYAFVLKLHPHVAESISFTEEEEKALSGFLYNISKTVPIDTALSSADILISDYSSLIFEYALLKRPMIFYAYDLEEYDSDRSFFYPYEEFVPGKIVKNTDELIEALKQAEKGADEKMISMFTERFMSACDGKSTQRILDLVE